MEMSFPVVDKFLSLKIGQESTLCHTGAHFMKAQQIGLNLIKETNYKLKIYVKMLQTAYRLK